MVIVGKGLSYNDHLLITVQTTNFSKINGLFLDERILKKECRFLLNTKIDHATKY